MTDADFMKLAIAEAKKAAAEGEIPIGAVLSWRGLLIAADHNRREQNHDPTAHAEILVLRKAGKRLENWRLTDTALYVTIEPCAMCAGAIMNARIDRLIYGSDDERAGGVCSAWHICDGTTMNHHIQVTRGVCEDECRRLMDDFFSARRTENP